MLSLGPLAFLVPWALAGLLALPVLWWLLRLVPPAPEHMHFPPLRLLAQLVSNRQTAEATPWWLIAIRLLLAAAVIGSAAHPVWNGGAGLAPGPVYLIIDDGWAAAPGWDKRQAAITGLIERARREDRVIIAIGTAKIASEAARPPPAAMDAETAARVLAALVPKPWGSDRAAAAAALGAVAATLKARPGSVFWLSDGISGGADDEPWLAPLRHLGRVVVLTEAAMAGAQVLRPPANDAGTLTATVERAQSGAAAWVLAFDAEGRVVAREAVDFDDRGLSGKVALALPSEMLNRVARLEIEGEGSAAGLVLMDERWRRRPVGLVTPEGPGREQPLLSGGYFMDRALEPFSEIRRGTVRDLLERPQALMILDDPGPMDKADADAVEQWMKRGGIVLRLAGPRLAERPLTAQPDTLVPVLLRPGDRSLGGAMSWSSPARLAPFARKSPFFGLTIPDEVTVQRQVLAAPSPSLAEHTWAQLADGTPLVTAAARGRGWLVLVHTTGNTGWSNLALSGLFVDMLRRLVELGQGVPGAADGPPYKPLDLLDGFGRTGAQYDGAKAVPVAAFGETLAGPSHPPGVYGSGKLRRVLNLSAGLAAPKPLGNLPAGVDRRAYASAPEIDFKSWLLALAILLLAVDVMAVGMLRGVFAASAAAALLAVLMVPRPAPAQEVVGGVAPALAASLSTRLAYVRTGESEVDEISRQGLTGLGVVVKRRTAAELEAPVAINPETDELAFYPLIYWPVTDAQGPPSAEAARRLNAFLHHGGTILFDTRGGATTDGMAALRRIGQGLDIPPLVPLPPDHVLGRAFYLLQQFPGRWTGTPLWIERAGERINDGVSSVIVGGNDWAAAWATDDAGRPLYAVVPGGQRQRELAYRFGINLVMHVLTGNYKADQVHMPEIMRRLGQ